MLKKQQYFIVPLIIIDKNIIKKTKTKQNRQKNILATWMRELSGAEMHEMRLQRLSKSAA